MVSILSTNDCTGRAHYQSSIMVRILTFLPLVLVHWSSYLQSSNIHTYICSGTVGGWEAIVMVGVLRSFGALVVSTWTLQLRVMR